MRGELDAEFARRRDERERLGRQRALETLEPAGPCRVRRGGVELIDFCSNDYLGLGRAPQRPDLGLGRAPKRPDGLARPGAGSSPLVSGQTEAHARLSAQLAEFLGTEAALLMVSGYQANLALGQALLRRGDAVLADRLNHASLNDGARLSGARIRRFAHADAADAEQRLDARVRWLATDAVFSMDGDLAPLAELSDLADRSGIGLWVDDAHGFGVMGLDGRGAAAAAGVRSDALVVTFGKSLGTQGAAILGERALIDELVNTARGVIYSTAMSPLLVAASEHALAQMQRDAWRRDALAERIERFRSGLARAGVEPPDSTTPIQPLVIGADAAAVRASDALAERGFLVRAIRPPTVPEGSARLRVTLSAAHDLDSIDALVQALADVLLDVERDTPLDVTGPEAA